MADKGSSVKTMLESTGLTKEGRPTRFSYTTKRNKRSEKKLELKKFDPRAWNNETGKLGMHVRFKEKKIPK